MKHAVPTGSGYPASIGVGLFFYWTTSLLVAAGVALGADLIRPAPKLAHKYSPQAAFYAAWDGQWYKDIAAEGYVYRADNYSPVAFFPAYPLLGRYVSRLSGLDVEPALLVVANVLLAGVFAGFACYIKTRFPDDPAPYQGYVLVALGLLPPTFFFRMTYSESTFMICQVAVLYAFVRRWPLLIIASLVGLATATRPVGVALIPALLLHLRDRATTRPEFWLRAVALVPVACSGLLGFIIYQAVHLGDPWAFVRTQAHWSVRATPSFSTKLAALVTLEPFRTVYDPTAAGYWGHHTGQLDVPFSLHALDPLYWLAALALIGLGWAKRWLSRDEIVISVGLLLIPYWTHGYEQLFNSMSRFTAAILPIYLVLGRLALRFPPPVNAVLAALSGFFLAVEAGLFARWHSVT